MTHGAIRLFVTDVDGCVSMPFRPPPLEVLGELVALHSSRTDDPTIPALTVCTGRPKPYAEAVAQWLAVEMPILFESGLGMYDPVGNQVLWSARIDEATERALRELRLLVHGDIARRVPGTTAEFAKYKDVGVVNPDPARVAELRRAIHAAAAAYPDAQLEIHDTPASVNVIPGAANKGAGLAWLAEQVDIPVEQMAYIGDSHGDLSALRVAAMPFAPANAIAEVKAIARVTESEATHAVLEAYRAVIAHNRQLAAASR